MGLYLGSISDYTILVPNETMMRQLSFCVHVCLLSFRLRVRFFVSVWVPFCLSVAFDNANVICIGYSMNSHNGRKSRN